MQTSISHLQFNVRPDNLPFYKDLMAHLGWQTIYADASMLGVRGGHGESLWFAGQAKECANDYDGPGMNHIGISAPTQADVDATVAYLHEQDVPALFETPRHRPDFSRGDNTYYQVMFESPDRTLWEVVYTWPKAA